MGTNLSRCDAPENYCEMRLRKERERGYREGAGAGGGIGRRKERIERGRNQPCIPAMHTLVL